MTTGTAATSFVLYLYKARIQLLHDIYHPRKVSPPGVFPLSVEILCVGQPLVIDNEE
jgi:hypothetical protein